MGSVTSKAGQSSNNHNSQSDRYWWRSVTSKAGQSSNILLFMMALWCLRSVTSKAGQSSNFQFLQVGSVTAVPWHQKPANPQTFVEPKKKWKFCSVTSKAGQSSNASDTFNDVDSGFRDIKSRPILKPYSYTFASDTFNGSVTSKAGQSSNATGLTYQLIAQMFRDIKSRPILKLTWMEN